MGCAACKPSHTFGFLLGEEERRALRSFGVATSGEMCSGHRVMWIGGAAFSGAGERLRGVASDEADEGRVGLSFLAELLLGGSSSIVV